jgi:hypothetical protein
VVVLTTDGISTTYNNDVGGKNDLYNKFEELVEEKKQLQQTIEIMKNYIKYEQENMICKSNEIGRILEKKEKELLYLKEENRVIINENKELKGAVFRMLHQIKLFEDAEAVREKELNVSILIYPFRLGYIS